MELRHAAAREPVRQRHDPQRIGQVLSNLIGNAIKFTPPGGTATVSLEATADGARSIVADTGVGIDAEELPHVFERFYRGTQVSEERAAARAWASRSCTRSSTCTAAG